MPTPPSGRQIELVHDDQRATITEVGATVRAYHAGGRPVLEPFALGQMSDAGRGQLLIPWPNRLADGAYEFDGERYQLPLSEPEKGNAIHGLLRWRHWSVAAHAAHRAVLTTRLYPMTGYPFLLDLTAMYALTDTGLTLTIEATNSGERPAPYGFGQHPYLSPGDGAHVDDCTLELRADTRILTDDERQLPTGSEPVEGTNFDFREPKQIGSLEVDHAFTDLARDDNGRASARLRGPDGATAELWVDEACPLIQIFTGDPLPAERRRTGLGCEPMTCAPNAFNSGDGLVRLEPGQTHRARWGARLT